MDVDEAYGSRTSCCGRCLVPLFDLLNADLSRLHHVFTGVTIMWWLFPRLPGFMGERWTVHSPPSLFFSFFFFDWRLARTHFLCQDQSTEAQITETTVADVS